MAPFLKIEQTEQTNLNRCCLKETMLKGDQTDTIASILYTVYCILHLALFGTVRSWATVQCIFIGGEKLRQFDVVARGGLS